MDLAAVLLLGLTAGGTSCAVVQVACSPNGAAA
jgi:hypothetical protein